MDRVRPSLVLLAALAALLGAPAAAHAAAPTNTTPAAPSTWQQSYTVDVSGDDVDGGPLTASGAREGMFVNTSGNARHGQAFVRAVKDGVEQHIYGSGDDRVVVSNEKS